MSVMTRAVARLLLPVTMMVAAAILIKGYADVGDGFSAGIVASLGVLLQYVAYGPALPGKLAVVRHATMISLAGLFLSLSVAFIPVFFGDPVRMAGALVGSYDRTPYMERVRAFLAQAGQAARASSPPSPAAREASAGKEG